MVLIKIVFPCFETLKKITVNTCIFIDEYALAHEHVLININQRRKCQRV